MSNPLKNLLAEIERAKEKAVKQWMAKGGTEAAYRSGEAAAFEFVIARLKSILEASDE